MITRAKPALILTALLWSTIFGLTTHQASAAEQCSEGCICVCEENATTEETTVIYSTKIQLSEIYPAPDTDEEEFIELYNNGSITIDLAGWKLADASGKTYKISSDDFISTEIKANGYFVIPHSISKIYLNNSDDTVLLYQPDDTLLDETSYEETEKGLSWSLINKTWTWTTESTESEDNIASKQTEEESENTESTTEDDTTEEDAPNYQTSDSVFLSEMLPNPTGVDSTDEWIEIVNLGDETIDLTGWQLTDTSKYYNIESVQLTAGEYLVFEVGVTGISLNNSGDTIFLIDPFGTIINGTEYSDCQEGKSWALINDQWQWTNQPTPGEENIAITENANENSSENNDTEQENDNDENPDTDVISIELLRSLEDGQTATVQGIVTVAPSVFGSQYFYIQDDLSGIQVYSYSKAFPELQPGDLIQVTGEKSSTHGEARLKTKSLEDIIVVATNQTVTPRETTALDESLEGMLVQVDGEIMESSSSEAIINDLIKIVMKSAANIDKNLLEEGASVAVLGIVGQYDDEYRLMPRSNEDIAEVETDNIVWINPAEAASSNPTSLSNNHSLDQSKTLLVIVIIGLLTIISGVALRQKKEKLQEALNGLKKPEKRLIEQNNIKEKLTKLFSEKK